MDKRATKSAENTNSVEKSNLSNSSIGIPEENGVSVPILSTKTDENEDRLDINSNSISEPFPDSVSVISIPSTSQSPDGNQGESKIVLIGTAHDIRHWNCRICRSIFLSNVFPETYSPDHLPQKS